MMNSIFFRVEEKNERSGHEREDDGMDNEHGERLLAQNFGLESDVQDDKLDQAINRERGLVYCQGCMASSESAYPLQLISDPIAPASLHLNPLREAAMLQEKNLDVNATTQIRTM